MKRLIIHLTLLMLLLTACGELEISADPLPEIAGAQATLGAGRAVLTSTAMERVREEGKATLQAARTEGAVRAEIELMERKLGATQTVQALEMARGQATDTARQAYATQTAGAEAAMALRAVETARAAPTATYEAMTALHEFNLAKQQNGIDVFWLYFWPVLGVLVIIGLAIFLFWLAVRVGVWGVRFWGMNFSVRVPDGRLVIDVDGWTPKVIASPMATNSLRDLPLSRGDGGVRALTRSGSVLSSPMANGRPQGQPQGTIPTDGGSASHLVLRLLERAIAVAGEGGTAIPRWDKLGMSSDEWQAAVRSLAAAQALEVRARVGTYVSEDYGSLAELLDAVEMRRLRVYRV